MLTTEELAAIPLFSTLQASDLKDLVRGSADIHLRAGEYLVLRRAGRLGIDRSGAVGELAHARVPRDAEKIANRPRAGVEVGDEMLVTMQVKVERQSLSARLGEPHDHVIEARGTLERQELILDPIHLEMPAKTASSNVEMRGAVLASDIYSSMLRI